MKVITKNTDYAIRSLLVLASNNKKYFSAKEISVLDNIPYQFLRRILQTLLKNEFLISKEGSAGGFKLLKKASSIKVSDIIQIFQNKIELSDCMFRKKICSNRATCTLRKEILKINDIVNNEFKNITIQKLLNKSEVK